MDNGLIFPYPCGRVPGESDDANRLKRLLSVALSGVVAGGVERGIRVGSSQAMG
jgi:hypothetical protein